MGDFYMEDNMSKRHKVLFPLIFAIVAVVGLFYVKWDPYYAKAFVAAAIIHYYGNVGTGAGAVCTSGSRLCVGLFYSRLEGCCLGPSCRFVSASTYTA